MGRTWRDGTRGRSYAQTHPCERASSTRSLDFTAVHKLRGRLSVRPRQHTASEEVTLLFVSPLAAIKRPHAESFLLFFPPLTLPHFHFSPLCFASIFFSLGFELYYLHSHFPHPPSCCLRALLSSSRGGSGDRRQPSRLVYDIPGTRACQSERRPPAQLSGWGWGRVS